MQETIKKHPSYGMLSFHRVHGAATPLFGSSVQHRDTIRLTLKEGEVKRSLNTDWYFGGKQLFEVEMSLSQFAELITSLNMGDGIPVTILSLTFEAISAVRSIRPNTLSVFCSLSKPLNRF